MPDTNLTRLSWGENDLGISDTHGQLTYAPITLSDDENSSILPSYPAHLPAPCDIILPIEMFLVRTFNMPLKHTRFLDASMLGQTLADNAGIEPEDWWYTWHAHTSEQGISGLAFALPNTIKQAIQQDIPWQNAPFLFIDAWERLNSWLPEQAELPTVVIDCDAEGVFFGYYHQSVWLGMRRLNADMSEAQACESICKDIQQSLLAMGIQWQTDDKTTENILFVGRITSNMQALLAWLPQNNITLEDVPLKRHDYNLKLAHPAKTSAHFLNIRHGKWAAKNANSMAKAWYRPATLAFATCLLWLGLTVVENIQLQQQLDGMNDDIITAFHRGLPSQTVIIDALAQLRKASPQGDKNTSGNASLVSHQLNVISEVFKAKPWQMQEFSMGDKGIFMSGKIKSLDDLNSMQQALQKQSGSTVQIADTDLKGNEVAFRMRWQ